MTRSEDINHLMGFEPGTFRIQGGCTNHWAKYRLQVPWDSYKSKIFHHTNSIMWTKPLLFEGPEQVGCKFISLVRGAAGSIVPAFKIAIMIHARKSKTNISSESTEKAEFEWDHKLFQEMVSRESILFSMAAVRGCTLLQAAWRHGMTSQSEVTCSYAQLLPAKTQYHLNILFKPLSTYTHTKCSIEG